MARQNSSRISGLGGAPFTLSRVIASDCRRTRMVSPSGPKPALAAPVAAGFDTAAAVINAIGAPKIVVPPNVSHRAINAKLALRLRLSMQKPAAGTRVTAPRAKVANGRALAALPSLAPPSKAARSSHAARAKNMAPADRTLQLHVVMTLSLGAGMGDRPFVGGAHQLGIFPKRAGTIKRFARAGPCRLALRQFIVRKGDVD